MTVDDVYKSQISSNVLPPLQSPDPLRAESMGSLAPDGQVSHAGAEPCPGLDPGDAPCMMTPWSPC